MCFLRRVGSLVLVAAMPIAQGSAVGIGTLQASRSTRRLAQLIAEKVTGKSEVKKRAVKILKECGINPKDESQSDMLVYTTHAAIQEMAELLRNSDGKADEQLAEAFGKLIAQRTDVPDMALSGRMLGTGGVCPCGGDDCHSARVYLCEKAQRGQKASAGHRSHNATG